MKWTWKRRALLPGRLQNFKGRNQGVETASLIGQHDHRTRIENKRRTGGRRIDVSVSGFVGTEAAVDFKLQVFHFERLRQPFETRVFEMVASMRSAPKTTRFL